VEYTAEIFDRNYEISEPKHQNIRKYWLMLSSVEEEEEFGEMSEMNEVVMEEVDNMQLVGMMGGKQSLVGTE
jgi:hypothetical protein